MRKILIRAGNVQAAGVLNDSPTADAIWKALPLAVEVNTWGDEIYFRVPVRVPEDNGQEVVAMGDLGYWPPGPSFCIFFGPTPMSQGKEIRPASAVNVLGKMIGDPKAFKVVRAGEIIHVERVPE